MFDKRLFLLLFVLVLVVQVVSGIEFEDTKDYRVVYDKDGYYILEAKDTLPLEGNKRTFNVADSKITLESGSTVTYKEGGNIKY